MIEDESKALAEAIYNTFKTTDGKTVFAWILNECGFFQTNPEKIKPELIALANRIMSAGKMTVSGDMGRYTLSVIESYENSDFIRS